MSGREWKPGDVAMVTWHAMGESHTDLRFRYVRKMVGEVWESPDGDWIGDSSAKVVRPLVVIDPEDREQVERLVRLCPDDWMFEQDEQTIREVAGLLADALREFADPTPPKPEEPTGLGAVVEDEDGKRWVRNHGFDVAWQAEGERQRRRYEAVAAVRVLSEGVQP